MERRVASVLLQGRDAARREEDKSAAWRSIPSGIRGKQWEEQGEALAIQTGARNRTQAIMLKIASTHFD